MHTCHITTICMKHRGELAWRFETRFAVENLLGAAPRLNLQLQDDSTRSQTQDLHHSSAQGNGLFTCPWHGSSRLEHARQHNWTAACAHKSASTTRAS